VTNIERRHLSAIQKAPTPSLLVYPQSRQIFFHLHSIVPEGRYKEKKELEALI
jgi:hypothetical protein